MPAPAKTTGKKSYNPTVTAFFDAPKFGLKDENGEGIEGSAFTSAIIDAKAFETIQNFVQLGTKLLLRQSRSLNKSGGRTFYLEVLPPLVASEATKRFTKPAANRANNDI